MTMAESTDGKTIRILIVDDHLVVRIGLSMMLATEPGFLVVGDAEGGRQALARLADLEVDVVLLDLRMGKQTGLDFVAPIMAAACRPKVLMLSSFDLDEDIYRASSAGVHGYILKDASREEISGAIRSVAAGKRYFPPGAAARISERSLRADLSPRENEVLCMVSKGLTNKEIGSTLSLSQFTVRNCVIRILGKLEASDRTEAVALAIQQGILKD